MNTKAVAFGLVIALVLTVGTVSALSNSGGGDWGYYKEIWIKENSGTSLSGYPVLVVLEPSNFPDKAKSDGSDLRFTEDGKELSYWVEEYNVSARTARIWVKVPTITANGEAKVKMYYGNPNASAVSDGNATFVFFDDFSGTTLDVNKWHEDAINNIDHTINNYFRFEGATRGPGFPHPYWIYDGSDTGSQHQAKWTPLNSFILEWNSKINDLNADEAGEGGIAVIATDNTIIFYITHYDGWSEAVTANRVVTDETGNSYGLSVNNSDEAKFSIVRS